MGASRVGRGVALVLLLLAASAVGPLAWGRLSDAFAAPSPPNPVTVPITPFRLVDTRPPPDGPNQPFGAGETRSYQAAGVGAVPADAVGVVLNITAVGTTADSFFTVWPAGTPRPNASTLNPAPGRITFNSATVLLGGGKFSMFLNAGSTHVLVDVVAYLREHNHDDRYLEQNQPIVVNESLGAYGTIAGTGPTQVDVAGGSLGTSPNGAISLPLSGVPAVGGTAYRLSQVEICATFSNTVAGEFINVVAVTAESTSTGAANTILVNDGTDRTTNGCFTLNVPASTAKSFGLLFSFSASPASSTANAIFLTAVRTTWVPSA